jgi:hypothetical protein
MSSMRAEPGHLTQAYSARIANPRPATLRPPISLTVYAIFG